MRALEAYDGGRRGRRGRRAKDEHTRALTSEGLEHITRDVVERAQVEREPLCRELAR
jgi:hypothetical protein